MLMGFKLEDFFPKKLRIKLSLRHAYTAQAISTFTWCMYVIITKCMPLRLWTEFWIFTIFFFTQKTGSFGGSWWCKQREIHNWARTRLHGVLFRSWRCHLYEVWLLLHSDQKMWIWTCWSLNGQARKQVNVLFLFVEGSL